MHLSSFFCRIALLCGLVSSATSDVLEGPAVLSLSAATQALPNIKRLAAPKFERPPPGYIQKRDQDMFVFGGFKTNDGECKDSPCKLEEPKDLNGRPHAWCQTFSGSNGYTPNQQPSIEYAHIDEVQQSSELPQWVCWFYNNFDCDPSKDKGPKNNTVTYLDNKMATNAHMPAGADFNFTSTISSNNDGSQIRLWYFKSYGCMLYDDAPFSDTESNSNGETSMGFTEFQAMVTAEVLDVGQGSNAETANRAGNSTLDTRNSTLVRR